MAVLVRFRENKKYDSDVEVIGKVMEGVHEGKVAFLEKGTRDFHRFVDQEIACEIISEREKSVVVRPTGGTAGAGVDLSNIFNDL